MIAEREVGVSRLGYEDFRELLRGVELPAAVIDLDAVRRNLAVHLGVVHPFGMPIRVASKSIRVPRVLEFLLEQGGGHLAGIMCFAAPEAVFLADRGFDDLLLAYPQWQRADLERIAGLTQRGVNISVVVDSAAAIDRLSDVGAAAGVCIRAVLCIDMSLSMLGGRAHLGVRRSPLREADDIVSLARRAEDAKGTTFYGLMGYEAQVAGLGDRNPFEPKVNFAKQLIRQVSAHRVSARRRSIAQALDAAGLAPRLVNGGGTGSLDTTAADKDVTEVTAGSGFVKSHLFDYYRNAHMNALEPACFFALEVTRIPSEGWVTCAGGGYVASGSVGADKAPLPWLPKGLEYSPMEMAGEVQTPLRIGPGVVLDRGDPVIFRPAKAGEWTERFAEVLLVQDGKVLERARTYRGEGMCFL